MKNKFQIKPSFFKKRIAWIVLFFWTLFMLYHGLFWLIGITGFICLIHILLMKLIRLLKKESYQKWTRRVWLVILIFVISICSRLFVVDVFKVPSSSMENTLFPEDIILVNKVSYGPKTPKGISEIPWMNMLFSSSENNQWKTQRWSGTTNIQQGDVLVFQRANSNFAVKRCVGLSGEQFQLKNGSIYSNEKKYNPTSTVKKSYEIHVVNAEQFFEQIQGLQEFAKIYPVPHESLLFEGHFTQEDAAFVKKLSSVKSIDIQKEKSETYSLFPVQNPREWNINDMGPFVIPHKGLSIKLNKFNFNIYQKTLEKYEKIELTQLQESFFINGKKVNTYVFQKDYIFVMGDHRKESEDSRFYGFIPVENVVGKVQCVLYSNYNNQFHWNRLFKGVQEKTSGL